MFCSEREKLACLEDVAHFDFQDVLSHSRFVAANQSLQRSKFVFGSCKAVGVDCFLDDYFHYKMLRGGIFLKLMFCRTPTFLLFYRALRFDMASYF